VRRFALALLACTAAAGAQMQMPPGTTSPVPDSSQQAAPNALTETLRKAEEAIGNGKYAEAITALTPAAVPSQKNERVFYDLGFAQDALGHDDEASAAYKQAIALDPNDAAARVSYGLLLARASNRTGAEEQLSAASKIPGGDPALLARANRALAEIHLPTNPEQARADLVAALQHSPETPEDAALAAEIADAMHDDAATEKAYAHAFQLNPKDADVAVGYARALALAKKFAQAEAVLTSARRANPDNRTILAELASEQLLQGHIDVALPTLEQLHTSEPGNAAIALLLARAYTASEHPDKADALFTALLAAAPEDVTLMAEAADHLIREKRSPEAEPLLQKALTHPEKFPTKQAMAQAAGELAFAASSNHDYETVLKALATRDAVLPSEAVYTFLGASAHDALHHTKLASEQYHLFLQQSGGKFPDQEWQAQQRLRILDRTR
jgi:Flp pilus assembly protein TadD